MNAEQPTTATEHAAAWLHEWDTRGGDDNGDTEALDGATITSPLTVGDLRARLAACSPASRTEPHDPRDIEPGRYAALDFDPRAGAVDARGGVWTTLTGTPGTITGHEAAEL